VPWTKFCWGRPYHQQDDCWNCTISSQVLSCRKLNILKQSLWDPGIPMETLINILVAVQIPADKNYSLSNFSISLSADKRFQDKKTTLQDYRMIHFPVRVRILLISWSKYINVTTIDGTNHTWKVCTRNYV